MGIKHIRILGFTALLVGASVVLSNCGRKDEARHAPVCPTGQYLYYDSVNYTCRFATVNSYGYGNNYNQYGQQYNNQYGQQYGQQYNNQYNNQYGQQYNQVGTSTVPVQACLGTNQILINWIGTWFCYFADQIYPGNSDSPQGQIPPVGRGGEFCLTGSYYGNSNLYAAQGNQYSGLYGGQYGGQYAGNYGNPNTVACSPGFNCQAQNTNQQSQTLNSYYYGGTSGQPGICTH